MEDQFNCEASGHACILVIVKLMKSHLRPLLTRYQPESGPNAKSQWCVKIELVSQSLIQLINNLQI